MKPTNTEERVEWIYRSQTNEELAERYAERAKFYEQDMSQGFDYQSPMLVADTLCKFVPIEARILDAGSGTGLVGQLLHNRGFKNLVAMDLSDGMLAEAEKKGVYRDLKMGVLGQPLPFPTDEFDAVVSAGVFTVGHAPASGFDELVRLTKPGGHIIFTLHSELYEGSGRKEAEFPNKFASIEKDGAWSLLETGDKVYPLPIGEPEVAVRILVYQVG